MFTTLSGFLMTLGKKPFRNIVGKGENDGNQHAFSYFSKTFSNPSKTKIINLGNSMFLSANAFSLNQSRILLFGKVNADLVVLVNFP